MTHSFEEFSPDPLQEKYSDVVCFLNTIWRTTILVVYLSKCKRKRIHVGHICLVLQRVRPCDNVFKIFNITILR